MLLGYAGNDAPIYAVIPLPDGQELCRQCGGSGKLNFTASYGGFERRESCQCPHCDGEGLVAA